MAVSWNIPSGAFPPERFLRSVSSGAFPLWSGLSFGLLLHPSEILKCQRWERRPRKCQTKKWDCKPLLIFSKQLMSKPQTWFSKAKRLQSRGGLFTVWGEIILTNFLLWFVRIFSPHPVWNMASFCCKIWSLM